MPKQIHSIGIMACAFVFLLVSVAIFFAKLTGLETVLLSLILAVLSAVASWLISSFYFEKSKEASVTALREDYKENLRMHALKAAEKVSNLSNELSVLASYIESVMEADDNLDARTSLLLDEQKFIGIVHVVRTLKSMNDTSLSDWEGVIGEELERKKQEEVAREGQLEGILGQLQAVMMMSGQSQSEQLSSLRSELRSLSSQFRTSPVWRKIEPVEMPCPRCNEPVRVKRTKAGRFGIRKTVCGNCAAELIVEPIGDNRESAKLELRRNILEHIECPQCRGYLNVELDNFPGSSTYRNCDQCGVRLLLSRPGKGGVKVEIRATESNGPKSEPQEDFINRVRHLLPEQPWETGVHKHIAEKLDVSPGTVRDAIQILIKRGIFKQQNNGVVVETTKSAAAKVEN